MRRVTYTCSIVVGASVFARTHDEALLGLSGLRVVLTRVVVFAVLRAMSVTRARLPRYP